MPGSRGLAVASVLAVALLGCGGGSSGVIDASIDAVLTQSSLAMAEVDTARFTIEKSGAAVHIDDEDLIEFNAADGRYSAPSSADALVKVRAFGLATEVGAVAIDGDLWITNPLTGVWEAAPADFTFDPTVLFDDAVGWSALLSGGLENAELVSDELDSDGRYQVQATVGADRVGVLTGGLVTEASDIDIFIDGRSGHIVEVAFAVGEGQDQSRWRLVLSDFGVDVTVTGPPVS
jgi:lipoprotein LprG